MLIMNVKSYPIMINRLSNPAGFTAESLLVNTLLRQKLNKLNNNKELIIKSFSGNKENIESEFDEFIKDISDHSLLCINIRCIDKTPTGEPVIRHIIVIDEAKKIRDAQPAYGSRPPCNAGINTIISGHFDLEKYVFTLYYTEDANAKIIHLNKIAIIQDLRGQGLMKLVFKRILNILKNNYTGWRTSAIVYTKLNFFLNRLPSRNQYMVLPMEKFKNIGLSSLAIEELLQELASKYLISIEGNGDRKIIVSQDEQLEKLSCLELPNSVSDKLIIIFQDCYTGSEELKRRIGLYENKPVSYDDSFRIVVKQLS